MTGDGRAGSGGEGRRRRGPTTGRLAARTPEERPREKLLERGPAALSDEELVALLLGTGTPGRPVLEMARELLSAGGLGGLLSRGAAGLTTLVPGIGPAKAARLAAVSEIALRLLKQRLSDRDLVADPESAADYLRLTLGGESQEVMGALLLDAKNRLLADAPVFRGTSTAAAVLPASVFRAAVLHGAVSVVLYHNHPSGDPSPSADDRATTGRFVEAGRALGVEVRDHLVVGRTGWVSFRRMGWLKA